MAENRADRRIRRTISMIRHALAQLIGEKGFDAITVSDLTGTADINRATFYLHYRDKYDLLNKCEEEILSDIESISHASLKHSSKSDLEHDLREGKPVPFLVELLTYCKENSDLIKALLGPRGDLTFHRQLKKIMEKNLMLRLKEEGTGNKVIPYDYITAYVISADLAMVQFWLEHGMHEDPETLALMINEMTFRGPAFAAGYQ